MSMPKVIDLDAIVVGTFTVKIKGKEYSLPRSVPLDTAFQMMELFRELQGSDQDGEGNTKTDTNQIELLFDLIAGLFQEKYPEMTAEALKKLISLQQCNFMLREVVSEIFDMESIAGNP